MARFNIKTFTDEPYVRVTGLAFLVSTLISYLVYDNVLDFAGLGIMIISITGIAFALRYLFPTVNLLNSFVVGFLAYAGYLFIVLFFKLTFDNAILYDELASAIIFGGLSTASYWALSGK